MKTIKICRRHQDRPTPLIWTFAFDGAEYWCPACGCNEGMMGAGEDVEETPELKQSLKDWKKKTKKFLEARSTLVCHRLKYKGEYIKPSELPKKVLDKKRKIVNDFKYEIES